MRKQLALTLDTKDLLLLNLPVLWELGTSPMKTLVVGFL